LTSAPRNLRNHSLNAAELDRLPVAEFLEIKSLKILDHEAERSPKF
jgi:hypothetical protein